MPMNKLREDVLTCAWQQVEKLLYHTIHKFRRRYGGEFDDYLGLAHLCFMRAFRKHDHRQAKFGTWAAYLLWCDCKQMLRRTIKYQQRLPNVFMTDPLPAIAARRAPTFKLLEFVGDLSGDAQDVVLIAIRQPDQHLTGDRQRVRLRKLLRALGWKHGRITAAFHEIGDALRRGK